MSNKAGLNSGPHPQSQGAASPSRRRLLQGLGLGALALGGSRLAQAAATRRSRWRRRRMSVGRNSRFMVAIRLGC